VLPWLYAALSLVVASGVRWLLHPIVGPIMPGTAFCIAAALIGYYFGIAPACVVMLLGLGIADYLFVPPYGQFDVLDQSDLALIISYPVVTILVTCLIERLRRAQFQAECLGRLRSRATKCCCVWTTSVPSRSAATTKRTGCCSICRIITMTLC
jgi:K+-sensing histidine kinase KdpD